MKNALYISWNEVNSLGVAILDEQHRGIVSVINSFHYLLNEASDSGFEAAERTLIMLEQYIAIHFKTEERLMEAAGYPSVEEHIALHKALEERTSAIRSEVGSSGDTSALLRFLRDWWLGHINKEDKKYAPFVMRMLEDS